jgi:hypothetical protein
MIPVELMSMAGGAVAGFALKFMAQAAADRQAQFERWIQTVKTLDDSANQAVQRVPNDTNGNWVRRIIVLAVLFGVILGPFILALLGKPVTVEIDTPVKTWLLGLLSTGGHAVFYEVPSYLLVPEIRQALLCIIAFYFGQAAAKR